MRTQQITITFPKKKSGLKNELMKMKNEEKPLEFKKDLHEWLAVMKAKQEAARKREAEEAYWNAPLNLKDRD